MPRCSAYNGRESAKNKKMLMSSWITWMVPVHRLAATADVFGRVERREAAREVRRGSFRANGRARVEHGLVCERG